MPPLQGSRVFSIGTQASAALRPGLSTFAPLALGADPAGEVYAVWQRGNDLVMARNFLGAPTAVRPDSTTMGFADFALTLGPGGNLLALWHEMSEAESDAHCRVFDPASNTWGLDTLLSNDAALERSFAPVWDAVGNLVLAYKQRRNREADEDGGVGRWRHGGHSQRAAAGAGRSVLPST